MRSVELPHSLPSDLVLSQRFVYLGLIGIGLLQTISHTCQLWQVRTLQTSQETLLALSAKELTASAQVAQACPYFRVSVMLYVAE